MPELRTQQVVTVYVNPSALRAMADQGAEAARTGSQEPYARVRGERTVVEFRIEWLALIRGDRQAAPVVEDNPLPGGSDAMPNEQMNDEQEMERWSFWTDHTDDDTNLEANERDVVRALAAERKARAADTELLEWCDCAMRWAGLRDGDDGASGFERLDARLKEKP